MQVSGFVLFDSIQLPLNWVATPGRSTPIMLMQQFHPPEHPDAEITVFKRRKSISPESVDALVKVLDAPPHLVQQGGAEILSLTKALGNVGNNQWSNRSIGEDGANFRLLHAETTALNGKNVLTCSGAFIAPASKKALNEYCGIFVPLKSAQPGIEEIYLQVPSKYGYYYFEKYLKIFRNTIGSVNWISSFEP